MLVYTIPEFAKEIKTAKENVYVLCELGMIKTLSFGSKGKTISIYEAERFLKEHAGTNFSEMIHEEKERKRLVESCQDNVVSITR